MTVSPSSSGAAPFTVSFSVTTAKLVSQYQWDFNGDGEIDETTTGKEVSHTFTTPGNYNVTVKVLDYNGNLTTLPPVTVTVTASGELTGPITFAPYYPASDGTASDVMKGGKAIRHYRISDEDGNPATLKALHYRFAGTAQRIDSATDDQGFVVIETDWLAASQQVSIEVLNADGSVKSDVTAAPSFYVNVTDREMEQEWMGLIGVRGSIGVGGPSLKLGPLKFETVRAGLEGGITTMTRLNYLIKGGEATVNVTNGIGAEIDASLQAGFFAQAWGAKKRPQIEIGVTEGVKTNMNSGATLELPDFLNTGRADHAMQTLSLAVFLLETGASSLLKSSGQLPFGFMTIYNKALASIPQNSAYIKNMYSETGLGLYGSAGASINLTNPLNIAGSGLTMSFGNVNAELVFNRKSEQNRDGSQVTTLRFTQAIDASMFKLALEQKFGGDARRKDTPKASLDLFSAPGFAIEGKESMSLAKDASGQTKNIIFARDISSSAYYASAGEGYSTEKSLQLEINDGNVINNLRNNPEGSIVNSLIQGSALGFTRDTFNKAYQTAMDLSDTPQNWSIERSDIQTFSKSFDVEVALGLSLGLGLDIEGAYSRKFLEQKGVLSSLKGLIKTNEYQLDSHITNNEKYLSEFFAACSAALTDAVASVVETVSNKVQDTVVAAGAAVKETAVGAWNNCVAFISKIVPVQKSQIIRASSSNVAGEATEFIATALGDVFIVNMKDDQGNVITDFSASPLELTLDYTDAMLANAGLSDKAAKLAIYLWDGASGFYIHQDSTVDQVNKKVTAHITKPGQYVLAIDVTPPVISDFKVSDGTTTPVISATIRDPFSGIDTSTLIFSLDGTTVVNSGNWADFFDNKSGIFKYIVSTPLAVGSHTAQIAVSDTAGNAAAQSQITFPVNNTPPVISHTPVTTSQTGVELAICTTAASDAGLQRVTLFYRPESGYYDYQSVEMAKGEGNGFCASIPNASVTTLGIRYYITAVDVSGNTATMPEPVVVSVTGNNAIPQVTGLTAALQSGGLLLSWDKSSAIVTAGYKVYSGDTANNLATVSDAGNFISVLLDGFDKTKAHFFAVAAYDGKGAEGQKSDIFSFGGATLYASFTDAGIWKYSNAGTDWTQTTTSNPQLLVTVGSDLYGTFEGLGIWKFNGTEWTQTTTSVPQMIVGSATTLYGAFSGLGIWQWNGSAWTQTTSSNPQKVVASTSDLYGTFAGLGIWKWNGTTWTQLTTSIPDLLVTSGTKLYGTFAGLGIWLWNGTQWVQATPNTPQMIAANSTTLYGTFEGQGIWSWDGASTWTQISTDTPTKMVASGTELFSAFAGIGVKKWDGTSWTMISGNEPVRMVVGQ